MTALERSQHGLGRLEDRDDRDLDYPLTVLLAALAAGAEEPPIHQSVSPVDGTRYWRTRKRLDQGETPQCVGYAWRHWLSYAPHFTQRGPAPELIYRRSQELDRWPGDNYDGTSVRAGAKYLQSRGLIANYFWAANVEQVIDFVLHNGTVVMGTRWYSNMFDPPANGLLDCSGTLAGGHAYLVHGYSTLYGLFSCINSWGSKWGQGGRFWLQAEDLESLLKQDGEACAAVERPIKA